MLIERTKFFQLKTATANFLKCFLRETGNTCGIGWVDFRRKFDFEREYPGVSSFLRKSTKNSKTKFFGQVTF
jgi:hypothetical protein